MHAQNGRPWVESSSDGAADDGLACNYCREMARHGRHRGSVARQILGLGWVVIVVVCGALIVPAFGYESSKTTTVVVGPLAAGSVTATCPKGEHVSFGGLIAEFKPPPKAAGHPAEFPTGMYRSAPDRWTVTGQSNSTGASGHLSAVAYCGRGRVSTSASRTAPLPGSRALSATATCPAGTVVVGGGYRSGSGSTHLEGVGQLLAPSSTRWIVSMLNLTQAPTTITAIAYCATGVAPNPYRTTLTLAAHKGGTAHVRCPSKTSLVFGGVDTSEPTGPSTRSSLVIPFRLTATSQTQWDVAGYNDGDRSGTLSAVAYCR
jgi:hypothetical protein